MQARSNRFPFPKFTITTAMLFFAQHSLFFFSKRRCCVLPALSEEEGLVREFCKPPCFVTPQSLHTCNQLSIGRWDTRAVSPLTGTWWGAQPPSRMATPTHGTGAEGFTLPPRNSHTLKQGPSLPPKSLNKSEGRGPGAPGPCCTLPK